MNEIRLLLIDDRPLDLYIQRRLIEGGFRDMAVTTLSRPPENLDDVLDYDGVILDEHLAAGVKGTDIARDIARLSWQIPVMIITGDYRLKDFRYVDYIASKDDPTDMVDKVFLLVRQIGRIKKGPHRNG